MKPLRDTLVLTRRNLIHIAREPLRLSDVTIQPVLFTLLFLYVLGAGIPIAGGSYKQFAIAGLLSLNLTTSAVGTAVGLSTDLTTGVIDRFNTLPMWRAAVLVGRSIADMLTAALCVAIVLATGFAVGWRTHHGLIGFAEAFLLALLFAYAMSWATACIGLLSQGPESAQSLGLVLLFPMSFVSNAMVPTQHMPSLLRVIAEWNPVSAITAELRDLFGNPNPSAAIHVWPMQHPLAASVLWSAGLVCVCAPIAVALYVRHTDD